MSAARHASVASAALKCVPCSLFTSCSTPIHLASAVRSGTASRERVQYPVRFSPSGLKRGSSYACATLTDFPVTTARSALSILPSAAWAHASTSPSVCALLSCVARASSLSLARCAASARAWSSAFANDAADDDTRERSNGSASARRLAPLMSSSPPLPLQPPAPCLNRSEALTCISAIGRSLSIAMGTQTSSPALMSTCAS
eukprot:1985921-Pleurochrysis_carterae.AAC.1